MRVYTRGQVKHCNDMYTLTIRITLGCRRSRRRRHHRHMMALVGPGLQSGFVRHTSIDFKVKLVSGSLRANATATANGRRYRAAAVHI